VKYLLPPLAGSGFGGMIVEPLLHAPVLVTEREEKQLQTLQGW
jgi:hypothetical protein